MWATGLDGAGSGKMAKGVAEAVVGLWARSAERHGEAGHDSSIGPGLLETCSARSGMPCRVIHGPTRRCPLCP